MAFVHGLLGGVVQRGLPALPYLEAAGIAPQVLQQPNARVTHEQYAALLQALVSGLADECVGFLVRPMRPGTLAHLARAAVSAPTLEPALRRLAHTMYVLRDDLQLGVQRQGPLAGMTLDVSGSAVADPSFLHEAWVRTFWRLMAWAIGGRLPIQRFDFAIARPEHFAAYEKVFPAHCEFGQPRSGFWFDVAWLGKPVRRTEEEVPSFLHDLPRMLVPQVGSDSAGMKVHRHLVQSGEWPTLEETSRALNMSPAALQRKLAGEGTTFRQIRDELRRDIAIQRLNTSNVSLGALAEELGFSDSASFQRAFKTWTGTAPGTYRRAQS